jgi:hypothetical protein
MREVPLFAGMKPWEEIEMRGKEGEEGKERRGRSASTH